MTTKVMFSSACIKSVSTQIVLPLKKSKSLGRDDEMDEAFFNANRTITLNCFEFFDNNSVANFATVTAAIISV